MREVVLIAACLWSLSGVLALQIEAAESGESIQGPPLSDQYWIGTGQGDLSKGNLACQRVAELAARANLARQIRVLMKEHMVDRSRERTGKEIEQDIELTREEIVKEYLENVKIVDRRIDDERKICTATAVMPRNDIQRTPAPATPAIILPGIR